MNWTWRLSADQKGLVQQPPLVSWRSLGTAVGVGLEESVGVGLAVAVGVTATVNPGIRGSGRVTGAGTPGDGEGDASGSGSGSTRVGSGRAAQAASSSPPSVVANKAGSLDAWLFMGIPAREVARGHRKR